MVEPRISIPLTRVRFPSSAPPHRDQRHQGGSAGEESPIFSRQIPRGAPGSLQPVLATYDWPNSAICRIGSKRPMLDPVSPGYICRGRGSNIDPTQKYYETCMSSSCRAALRPKRVNSTQGRSGSLRVRHANLAVLSSAAGAIY